MAAVDVDGLAADPVAFLGAEEDDGAGRCRFRCDAWGIPCEVASLPRVPLRFVKGTFTCGPRVVGCLFALRRGQRSRFTM